MRRRVRISLAEARRIALAAQGFDRERPTAAPDARHFAGVLARLGLLQLDFVNVLVPAQFLVVYSRLGAYDRSRFERYLYGSGRHTEQWAHEASAVPVDAWPLLAHRRAAWRHWRDSPLRHLPAAEKYLDEVLERVRSDGALTADELPAVPGPKRKPGDWHRSMPRQALEHHFGCGKLAVRGRKPNFQRIYDLPERVVPAEHLERGLSAAAEHVELLHRAVRACGIGTLQDFADYYRMSPRDARAALAKLQAAGQVAEVQVTGWSQPAWLAADARCPRAIPGASLLSPFDPVVWFRPRAERLFRFHYRIEIYVPAQQRRWGYYVLPFRLGDELVARVDLKAERLRSELHVRAAYVEDGADADRVAPELAQELQMLAGWLGLDGVRVTCRRRFGRRVARELPSN